MKYNDYLKSDWWINKRNSAKETKTYKAGCLICGNPRVDIHHLTYEKLWEENLNKHLIVLCRQHHEEFHNWQRNNDKLEGDVLEFTEMFYPKEFKSLNKFQKGKIEKFSSNGINKKIKRMVRKLNILRDQINKLSDSIVLSKKQRGLLPPGMTNFYLDKLGVPNGRYDDRMNYLTSGVLKTIDVTNYIDNFSNLYIENENIKKMKRYSSSWLEQ